MVIRAEGDRTGPPSNFAHTLKDFHSIASIVGGKFAVDRARIEKIVQAILLHMQEGSSCSPDELLQLERDISHLLQRLPIFSHDDALVKKLDAIRSLLQKTKPEKAKGYEPSAIPAESLEEPQKGRNIIAQGAGAPRGRLSPGLWVGIADEPLPKDLGVAVTRFPGFVKTLWDQGHIKLVTYAESSDLLFSEPLQKMLDDTIRKKLLFNEYTLFCCMQSRKDVSIISELIKRFPDDTSIQLLMKQLDHLAKEQLLSSTIRAKLEEIAARFEQIISLPNEQHGLTRAQIAKLAYFISVDLEKVADCGLRYFKKSHLDIPRTIVKEKEGLFLLSKRKVKILNASGTYKRVTSALYLPALQLAKRAELVAQSVTKDSTSKVALKTVAREMHLHQMLNGLPGIWPIYCWFEYVKSGNIQKISAFTPFAEETLATLEKKLPFESMLQVCTQLIHGVHSMHEIGCVHGDLKLLNALRRGRKVGLTDFGFTFKNGIDKPPVSFELGYYGSIFCTPPEVFGNKNFAGDYFKTDVWALGIMLYKLRFGKAPPWVSIPEGYYDGGKCHFVDEAAKNTMRRLVHETIEVPLAALKQSKVLTVQEEFDRLIYSMLRLDPDKRAYMAAIAKQCNDITSFLGGQS